MELPRGFKGVWIPKDIWLAGNLTLYEKVFMAEVDSLDAKNGCYAGNDHFAKFLGTSESKVTRMITKLRISGMISVEQKNLAGKTVRYIKSASANCLGGRGGRLGKLLTPPRQIADLSTSNTNKLIHKTMLRRKKPSKLETHIDTKTYNDVYRVLEAFEPVNVHWHTLQDQPKQYDASMRMIRIHGVEKVLEVVALLPEANTLKFFPRICTPMQLEEKWQMLHNAYRGRQSNIKKLL